MFYLINWCNDWFHATIRNDPSKKPQCHLQGANDTKLESIGFFHKNSYPTDKHYYQFFESDPGFRYFDTLLYQGCPIGICSIDPFAKPRQVLACTGYFGEPPEPNKWKHDLRDGIYQRYLKIDDIDKEETTPPDWSQKPRLGNHTHKKYLVLWHGHWFWAVIKGFCDISFRCRLQGANNPNYETLGFKRGRPGDLHYYKFFKTDPGFTYYRASYKGKLVNIEAIDHEIQLKSVLLSVPKEETVLPEIDKWQFIYLNNFWKYVPRLTGWYRYIPIDALSLEEVHVPNWINI